MVIFLQYRTRPAPLSPGQFFVLIYSLSAGLFFVCGSQVWDNRQVLHRADYSRFQRPTSDDQKRVMWHVGNTKHSTIYGNSYH